MIAAQSWVGTIALLVLTTACQRTEPVKSTPADVITVEVRIRRERDTKHGVVIAAPRLTAESGSEATYAVGDLRLVVRPISNGDRTVTIRAILYEHADTNTPDMIACPDTTVADGGSATNQVGPYFFTLSPTIARPNP